tara:strand:+ start:428 stop:697 length:270 start_codon:yes stop_codon:yes gene_type:complete
MEDQEETKECPDYVGHGIRIVILCWALSVMTLGYMERIRLDTFAAGLVGNIASAYGVSVKGNNGNGKNSKKPQNKGNIVDNKDTNVGIK